MRRKALLLSQRGGFFQDVSVLGTRWAISDWPRGDMKTWLHLFSSFFSSGSGARSPRPSVIGIHRMPSTKMLITQIRHLLLSPVIKIAAASRWRAGSD